MEKIMMRVALVSLLSLVVACSGPRQDESRLLKDEVVVLEEVRFPGADSKEVRVAPGIYRVARTNDSTLRLSREGTEHLLRAGPADIAGEITEERAILAGSQDSGVKRLILLSKAGSMESVGYAGGVRSRGALTTFTLTPKSTITVTGPTSSAVWFGGMRQTIQWTGTGTQERYLKVAYWKVGEGQPTYIYTSILNTGSCYWTPPKDLSGRYTIYVSTLDSMVSDVSDPMTILPPADFRGMGDFSAGDPWLSSTPYAVSGDGSVVVGSMVRRDDGSVLAFRWTESTGKVGLGWLPSTSVVHYSRASGVSEGGVLVVGVSKASGECFYMPAGELWISFIWSQWNDGKPIACRWLGWPNQPLDLAGGQYWNEATGVSADGLVVVGSSSGANGGEAFLWTGATGMVGLGDLPGGPFQSKATAVSGDGSVVVGSGNSADGEEAFRWTSATGMVALGDFPGGSFSSEAKGLSRNGAIVVGRATGSRGGEAFRWTAESGIVSLGDFPGGATSSTATGVSGDGSVIVGTVTTAAGDDAFIWDEAHGLRSLCLVAAACGGKVAGWRLSAAHAISADGRTIVGEGVNPSGHREGWILTLPVSPTP